MKITLPASVEYYAAKQQLSGCSTKTLIPTHSNPGKFIRFLQGRQHSPQLAGLSPQDARA